MSGPTKAGDIIILRRRGSAVCVVTRILEDGDDTGLVEYMGSLDPEDRARRLTEETGGQLWQRTNGGPLTKL
jgi:hypothetical protein